MQVNGSLLVVIGLALVHILAAYLRKSGPEAHNRWVSLGGGIAVAYVFLHLLPDLNQQQQAVAESEIGWLNFVQHHVYLTALVGLALFYGLERVVASRRSDDESGEQVKSDGLFWGHVGSFAAYNILIGYIIVNDIQASSEDLVLFAVAIGLHFLVNDYSMHETHQHVYNRVGRWVLAVSVILGWCIGSIITIDAAILALLYGFLGGGIILNVLKEELPQERNGRFGAFALGAAGYAALLMVL